MLSFFSYFSLRGIREGGGGFAGKSGVESVMGLPSNVLKRVLLFFFLFSLSFIHSSTGHSFAMFVTVMSFWVEMKCSGGGGDEGTIDEALVFLGSFSQLRIGDQLVENLILIAFFP